MQCYRYYFLDFDDFKQDLFEGVDPDDGIMNEISGQIENIIKIHGDIGGVLGTFTHKLVRVLGQHEDDFIYAYKMHMVKIEKEL